MLLDAVQVARSLGIAEEGQIWELCSYSTAKPLFACSLRGPQVHVHEMHQVRQLRCSEAEELVLIHISYGNKLMEYIPQKQTQMWQLSSEITKILKVL